MCNVKFSSTSILNVMICFVNLIYRIYYYVMPLQVITAFPDLKPYLPSWDESHLVIMHDFWYVISSKLLIFCGGWLYLVTGVLWIKALLSSWVIRQPCSCVSNKAYTYTNWRHSQRCSVMQSYEITVRHKVHRCVKYHTDHVSVYS